jgi:UDP-glucoronosyl and UDP-glucosyl transferase
MESPLQGFSSWLTRNYDMDAVMLPAGSWAIVFYGAANRDERKLPNPHTFDVTCNSAEEIAFGSGPHHCVACIWRGWKCPLFFALWPRGLRNSIFKKRFVTCITFYAVSTGCWFPSNKKAVRLPRRDDGANASVLLRNGGYGSVNQAMSFGIPLVTAGLTEDKADVNARVAWSGVGIDLATNEPTPQALREAIRTVLDKPNYRSRASLMADEFDGIDTRSEILRIVSQVSHISDENGLRRGEAAANKTLRRKKVAHATC